jgi:hypothetical protein
LRIAASNAFDGPVGSGRPCSQLRGIDIELARRRALPACDLVHLRHALDEIGKQLLVHRAILPVCLRRRTPLLRLPTLFRIGSEAIADRIRFARLGGVDLPDQVG